MLEPNADLTPAQRAIRTYTQVSAETCRRSLRKFVKTAWPLIDPKPFVNAWHIDAICDHLAYVLMGDIRNLMINIPPRMTKSSVISVAFPAWVWCDQPDIQFLAASYASDLAEADALKSRQLIESKWYQERYGHEFALLADMNKVNSFGNTMGGYRKTISVGSKTTGMGGDIKILDDPHNATEVESDAYRKAAINWHDNAWKSRNNDPNKVRNIYVGQRTHDGDMFGHVLAAEAKRWVHLNLPMEYDGARKCVTHRNKGKGPEGEPLFRDPRETPNSLLCPARFDADTATATKDSTPTRTWNAQYQQQPEGAGGVILKRGWWRKWGWPDWHPEYRKTERPLPEIVAMLQVYDTAFEQGEQDSFCVRTTWGMFEYQELVKNPGGKAVGQGPVKMHAMLLEKKKWKPSYAEMREEAIDANKIWEPDRVLIEKKASGHSLIKELRAAKPSVPVKGIKVLGDLVYRAHMSSLPLEKGHIWYIERAWAKDLIEECAKFPNVDFNDQVSSTVMALAYIKTYMFTSLLDNDDEDDLALFQPPAKGSFYG
jgi:predicted phage terminase large subunit-like protein